MWELLGNISSLVTIITCLISIPGGIIAANRLLKHKPHSPLQQGTKPNISTQINKPSFKTSILEDLDIWDKAEVIGYGIFDGMYNGFIALAITFLILFFLSFGVLLFLVLTHLITENKSIIMNLFWTISAITLTTGIIVGVLVGVVSGVNETKVAVERKWLSINSRKYSGNKPEFKLLHAPLLKTTNNHFIDQVYYDFSEQIKRDSILYRFMGTLIIYTKDDQFGEVVSLMDRYYWENYPENRIHSLFVKQTYVKSHRTISYSQVYAAVFKDLQADKAYVIWSDTKQPAYVVASAGEATLIDWSQ